MCKKIATFAPSKKTHIKMKLSKLLLIIAAIVAVVPSCKKTTTQLEDDTKAIKSYLSANGIQAQESNKVFYQVITEGTGEQCNPGDTVAVKYKMATIESPDKIVQQNKGDKAVIYFLPSTLGSSSDDGAPIYGVQLGMVTMKEGGKSRFYIPSSYAYGSSYVGPDSVSYANIIYEVELCEILRRDKKH